MISPESLRAWLTAYQFWVLEALFLALLVSTAVALPGLVRSLALPRRWWLGLAGIALSGLAVVYTLPPATNRIYYDEQIYQHVGQNLSDLRRSQMCNHGIVEYGQLQCHAGEYNKEPYGYPYLLSVGYRVLGVSDALAHHVNRAAHALMAIVLALIAVRWFNDRRAGLLAASFISVIPEQLRWSASAAAETSAALFTSIAVLAAVEFCRSPSRSALAWLVCAAAWSAQLRPESIMVLAVVGVMIASHAPEELGTRRILAAALIGSILLTTYVVHLLAVRHESWGAAGARFSLEYFPQNLSVNGWFYFWDRRFPFWMGPLAIAGFWFGGGTWRSRLVLALYFLLFWGVFLFFYAGSYNYGADVRFSLLSHAPVVLLSALGASAVLRRLAARQGFARATAVVAGAVLWVFLWQTPYVRSVGEEAWAARADVAFAKRVSAGLPADALVLTHDPNMFFLWGRNAAQLSFARDPNFLLNAQGRHGRHVFVHWGFWCNVPDPAQQQVCSDAIAAAGTSQLHEEYSERNFRFVFYRVEPK
jgi:hypothetical protein